MSIPCAQIVALQYCFPPKETRALGEMTDCRARAENVQDELKHLVIPNSEEASSGDNLKRLLSLAKFGPI